MGNVFIKRTSIEQNLLDAGCDEEFISRYMCLSGERAEEKQLGMLGEHRKALLEQIHSGQKQLDCLDYLIYETKKCRRK